MVSSNQEGNRMHLTKAFFNFVVMTFFKAWTMDPSETVDSNETQRWLTQIYVVSDLDKKTGVYVETLFSELPGQNNEDPLDSSISMAMHFPSSSHLKYRYNYSGTLPLKPKNPINYRPRNAKLTYRGYIASASASEPILTSSSGSAAVKERGVWVTESGHFSVTDSQLNSRGFELHRTMDNLDLDQLNSLFAKVGFVRREKEKLIRSLHNTPSILWLEYKKSGKVVAFARATGDDVFNAVIWDVVVDPSFQGCGLGKAVMERLMSDLLGKGITNIALYAEPNVLGFYRPLGFIADPDGIKAMVYYKKKQR